VCGQFETFFALIGARVSGNGFVFEIDCEGAVVCFDNHLFGDGPRGHGIGIGIEADGEVGGDFCKSGVPAIREELGQGSEGLYLEAFDRSLPCCAMDSHIGDGVSPMLGLGLEVEEVFERAQGPEVMPDVVNDPFFHFALFVWASRITGPGDNGKGAEEVQESPVKADDGSHSLGDRCQHVVCNEFFGGTLEKTEGVEKATVEGFLLLAVSELQVEQTAVAFQDRQTVELALGIPVGDGSEVAPINLALLPWQRLKTDEGFFLSEVSSQGVQIVLQDRNASLKAQWADPLENDSGGGLGIDLKKPVDFFLEGVQLAWPSSGWPLGVRVDEELSHGFWIDMEGGGYFLL